MAVGIDYSVFPYLVEPGRATERWPGLSLLDLARDAEGSVYRRSLEILEHILAHGSVGEVGGDVDVEVAAFHVLMVLVRALGDRRVLNRVALAYSKLAYERLRGGRSFFVAAVAKALGLRVVVPRSPVLVPLGFKKGVLVYRSLPLAMWFRDYLRFSARLSTDPKYIVTNQLLDKGMVYLEKEVAARVVEEAVYSYIVNLYNGFDVDESVLGEALGPVRELVSRYYKSGGGGGGGEPVEPGQVVPEAFPPCIKNMIERLKAGENLSHHERFTIAAFLARIGMDVEDILDLFRNSPDFNERIARYQIEHIAGLRGSRKKYMPYSCGTLKSLGLCPIEGDCGARNPLAVYRRNLRRLRRRGGDRRAASNG